MTSEIQRPLNTDNHFEGHVLIPLIIAAPFCLGTILALTSPPVIGLMMKLSQFIR